MSFFGRVASSLSLLFSSGTQSALSEAAETPPASAGLSLRLGRCFAGHCSPFLLSPQSPVTHPCRQKKGPLGVASGSLRVHKGKVKCPPIANAALSLVIQDQNTVGNPSPSAWSAWSGAAETPPASAVLSLRLRRCFAGIAALFCPLPNHP